MGGNYMAQTNLKSDDFCGYNQESAPFFWIFEPGQYENTYVFGEVGVSAAGGTAGSYVRPDVIDISSFLSGRDDMLSKCQPPAPNLETLKTEQLKEQNTNNTVNLLPKYTREKRSAIDLSTIDYNRWQPQDIDPQDLRFVIEDFSAQRGGLDTQNYTKLAWANDSNLPGYRDGLCKTVLDPSRACGSFCEDVSGFPGRDWLTGEKKSVVATPVTGPPSSNEPEYPFRGPFSQQVFDVSGYVGPNFFYGPRYDQGTAPVVQPTMLKDSAIFLK